MLTTLYMALPVEAIDLIVWYRNQIVAGRWSPDPEIVFSLFRSLGPRGKIDLAISFCGSSLDTPNFVKLISHVYKTCTLRGLDRNYLAQAISRHAALYRNISSPGFVRLTRKLLFSRSSLERGQGALCVESLARVPPELVLRVAELVRDPLYYIRANAWCAANALLYQGRLSAEAYQSLLQDSRTAIKDENKILRGNARLFRRRARELAAGSKRPKPSRR